MLKKEVRFNSMIILLVPNVRLTTKPIITIKIVTIFVLKTQKKIQVFKT